MKVLELREPDTVGSTVGTTQAQHVFPRPHQFYYHNTLNTYYFLM
jgi:hypothetical protein